MGRAAGPRRRPPPSQRRARRSGRRNQGSDFGARLLAALPAIAFAIFIVVEGGIVWTLGLMALGLVCLHELYGMFDRARPVRLAGFLALVGLLLAAHYGSQFQILLVAVLALPLVFWLSVVGPPRPQVALSIAVTVLGIYWIGFAFAHAVLLRDLHHGNGVVIDVLVGTFLGDTGAYLGGRLFGQRPLAPRISPNKTVEGLAFGIVTAVAAVWFAGLYQDWLSGTDALILGIAVAVTAPVGDLFESLIKRSAGTKDAGSLFGPHGGALDRLDAVLFAVVTGYYVWVALT